MVEAPTVMVETPHVTVETLHVTVEAPTVMVETPTVTVETRDTTADVPSVTHAPSQGTIKVVTVLVVVALLLTAQQMGVFKQFAEPAVLAKTLVDLGPRGYLAFILAYALLQPFGVPGTLFVFAAALIWPWPTAFALSMIGTMAASVIGFSFIRFVARDWVAGAIPERFHRYDDALAKHALATVFVLRLIFWMPQALHAFFAVSKVRFWTHFWGSLGGYILPLFLMSYFGQRLFDAARQLPTQVWIGLGIALVAVVATAVAWRHRRRPVSE